MATAWSYSIDEVRKPSLLTVEIGFTLLRKGTAYAHDVIALPLAEIQGLSEAETKDLIKSRILSRVDQYKKVDDVVSGLQGLVGTVSGA